MSVVMEHRESDASPVSEPRDRLLWLLLLGWLAQVVLRLWLSRFRMGPVILADEAGYLAAARLLAGGPGADLSWHTFYQGGYALLLAPAFWVSDDPVTVYRLVMGINALSGALIFPLAYLALKRLGKEDVPLAWAASLLPAVVFFGRYALADAILPVVVLAWLLALDRFIRRGDFAVPAALLACFAWAVHSRGVVFPLVQGVVLLCLIRRWRRPALLGLAVTVLGGLAVLRFNTFLLTELYPSGARDLGGNLLTRLTSLDGQGWALSGAVGQIWYLITSTWGLAGVGLVAVAAAALRRRPMALVLCAVTFGIAYASTAALPDEDRVGNFAYGRYLSCVAVVYVLIGLRALADRRAVLGAIVALCATAWIVLLHAGERLRTDQFIAFDFPEIIFLTRENASLELGLATATAAALLAVFALVPRPVVVLAIVNAAALLSITSPFYREPVPGIGLPEGGVLTERNVPWRARTALLHEVSWTKVGWYDLGSPVPPGVCAVIVPWPDGASLESTWPDRPASWRGRPGHAGTAAWTCR